MFGQELLGSAKNTVTVDVAPHAFCHWLELLYRPWELLKRASGHLLLVKCDESVAVPRCEACAACVFRRVSRRQHCVLLWVPFFTGTIFYSTYI